MRYPRWQNLPNFILLKLRDKKNHPRTSFCVFKFQPKTWVKKSHPRVRPRFLLDVHNHSCSLYTKNYILMRQLHGRRACKSRKRRKKEKDERGDRQQNKSASSLCFSDHDRTPTKKDINKKLRVACGKTITTVLLAIDCVSKLR